VQSIDDQIMCMVGMGFELEDCQAAVENGKLTVDDAVEWYMLCLANYLMILVFEVILALPVCLWYL